MNIYDSYESSVSGLEDEIAKSFPPVSKWGKLKEKLSDFSYKGKVALTKALIPLMFLGSISPTFADGGEEPLKKKTDTTIVLEGNVKSNPFGENLPGIQVLLQDETTLDTLALKYTNSVGNWADTITITGINDFQNLVPTEYKMASFPNPYNPSATVLVDIPQTGNYNLFKFNVLGEKLASWSGELSIGTYQFKVGGGPAGIEFMVIEGEGQKKVQKTVHLDGDGREHYISAPENSSYNIPGSVKKETSTMEKVTNGTIMITYKDTTGEHNSLLVTGIPYENDIFNEVLERVYKNGSALYTGHITTEPGGGNGTGLDIHLTNTENDTTLSEVVSDGLGNWEAQFPFVYRTNGVDSLYNIQGVNINISGTGVNPVNKTVEPFAKQYNWNAIVNLTQQFVTATYNLHASNLQTGENVPDAADTVRDQNNNFLFTITTDANGNATKTYQNSYTVKGNDTLWTITQLNSTLSKTGYNTLQFSDNFQQTLNLEKELDKIPFVVNFTLNPWNILGFQVTDPVMKSIGQDSTRTHLVDTDGKIHFNYTLFNDVVEKDIKLVQTNGSYNPYLTIIRLNQTPDQLNLFENNISGPESYQNVPDTLVINLDVMNSEGNANLILEPSHVYHPVWGYVSTMSDTLRSFIGEYVGIHGTTRWSTTGVNDSTVKIFNLTWEETTGNPVPAPELEEVESILDTILSKTVHPSGKVLFQYDRYLIDSLQDPNWINATQNFTNIIYTRHANQTSFNFIVIHPENGFANYGDSGYAVGIAKGQKASEILSSLTGMGDNIHGTSPGVAFNSDLSINDLGTYLIYKNWMSNPGRRVK